MFQEANIPVEEGRKESLSVMKTWAHIGIKSMIRTLAMRTSSMKIQL